MALLTHDFFFMMLAQYSNVFSVNEVTTINNDFCAPGGASYANTASISATYLDSQNIGPEP